MVILATKMSGPGNKWIRDGGVINKKNLQLALEDSLKRLQTDYVDLYQLHWPNRGSYHFGKTWNYAPRFDVQKEADNFLEVLQTIQSLIREGKIRHFGLSNETAWGLTKWLQLAEQHELPRVVSIQNEFSLMCRHFEPDLSEITTNEDVGLLAWSPLCRGMLSGKYLNGARPEGSRLVIETRVEFRDNSMTHSAISEYIECAKRHELDPCQMAIAFVNSKPFVASTLVGATSMTQLKTDVDSLTLKLPAKVFKEIEVIHRKYPATY
jgi:aryl-alcohol dehydrogenase-like predicted oxidoreductase